MARYFQIF
jgi:hypothetical protein